MSGMTLPAMDSEPTKKRKRKKKKRGKNKVTPVTAFTAPDGAAQAAGPRRPSAVSIDSNASAHSVRLSLERPDSSDTASDRGRVPAGQHPAELTTQLPPQFTAVNHMTSYSMFTASSFLPGMIELTDLDNPAPQMQQTPKTVPSSGKKSNNNHTYSNPIATDLTDEIVDVDEIIEIGDQSDHSIDSI